MSKLVHITTATYPAFVKIIEGAPTALVGQRELRNKYETNRDIKYWSTFFLLKSLTTTGYIQHWTRQQEYILTFLRMNAGTLRKHIRWMEENRLAEYDRSTCSIRLVSFERAAECLGIEYTGTYEIEYNYKKYKHGTIPFQYLIRGEEIRAEKLKQLDVYHYKLDQNPSYKNDLIYLLIKDGCDGRRLYSDKEYFAQRHKQLQVRLFREGSELLDEVMLFRPDCNRGVLRIADHHCYKSPQSVSYLKRRLAALHIAEITKKTIYSDARSRIYIVDKLTDKRRDGYKYLRKHHQTAWFHCDDIALLYGSDLGTTTGKSNVKAA